MGNCESWLLINSDCYNWSIGHIINSCATLPECLIIGVAELCG